MPTTIYPALCSASETGLLENIQGSVTYFNVSLKDEYSNPINATAALASSLRFYIDKTILSDVTIQVIESGTINIFKVAYYAPYSFSYSLNVTFNGEPIQNSPFVVSSLVSVEVTETDIFFMTVFAVICIIMIGCFTAILLIYWYQNNHVIKASSPTMMFASCVGTMFVIIGVWRRLNPLTRIIRIHQSTKKYQYSDSVAYCMVHFKYKRRLYSL